MRVFLAGLAAQVLGGLIVLAVSDGTLADWSDEPVFWLTLLAAALVNVTGVLGYSLWRSRHGQGDVAELEGRLEEAQDRAKDAEETLYARVNSVVGPSRVIGIDIGRVWLSIGVLSVTPGKRHGLPRLICRSPVLKFPSPLNPRRATGDGRYGDVARSIVTAMKEWPGEIDGIGIGIPGQVDLVHGSIDHEEAFPPAEPFAANLAATLAADDEFRKLMGRDEEALMHFLHTAILVDNDVRCATRRVLSNRLDVAGWDNFACIFVGGGVGAGFVFNREIYYGRRHCAGEVGHMTLHLSPYQHRGTSTKQPPNGNGNGGAALTLHGLTHQPAACSCGHEGVHWETLVKGPGLEDMAEALDARLAERIAAAFGYPEQCPAAKQLTLTARLVLGGEPAAEALDEDAVRGAMEDMARDAHRAATPAQALPAVQQLARDDEIRAYLGKVLDCYSHYFGVGIANLTNVLDLDHIALGGGVMDALWPLDRFQTGVWKVRERYTLKRAFRNNLLSHDADARPGWAWEGAALLFWDPGFAAVRAAESKVPTANEVVLAPV
jgi:predicted NBD/HSP70 family sugar kinase